MATSAERQRQYELLAEMTADVRYCYELEADGGMVRRWITGSFPGAREMLPRRTDAMGCWMRVVHPDDREQLNARHKRLLSGERSTDEFRIVLPELGVRWVRVFGVPERDPESGRVLRILGAAQDITAHREGLQAASAGEAEVELLAEGLPVLISHVGADQRYRLVNAAYERWFGLPRERILGRTVRELIGDDAYERARSPIEEVQSGRVVSFENTLRLSDGRARIVMITMVPRDPADAVQGFYTMAIDVSELKEAERRQGALMSELDHRVKNVLAAVQAMVKLSSGAASADDHFATVLLGRIQALARAHDLLARNRWLGAELGELVRGALSPFAAPGDPRVAIGGEPLVIGARVVGSIAIICHELAVNAARHGALSSPGGRVEVHWRTGGDAGAARLELIWAETGDRPVSPPERRGFGTLLIERAAAYELGGESRLDFRPDGLRYRLDVPLAEIAPSAGPESDG